MASDGVLVLPDDTAETGKNLRTRITTEGEHQERMVIGGETTAAQIGAVNADPAQSGYGLPVRPIPFTGIASARKRYSSGGGAFSDDIMFNPGAVAIFITQITISASAKNSVPVDVFVGLDATDASAGDVVASPAGLAPGTIYSKGNGAGVIAKGATSDDVLVDMEEPLGGDVDVEITYFTV